MTWLPAFENKGEGIFLQFRSAYLYEWLQRPGVIKQGAQLKQGFDAWKAEWRGSTRAFPGLPYIALHSFSHLLLTAVALECGYPASSVRERIYPIANVGYGVLLYTGSSDAEGTLGGLIEVGRGIHDSVRNALELGLLCSNDPVCGQAQPCEPPRAPVAARCGPDYADLDLIFARPDGAHYNPDKLGVRVRRAMQAAGLHGTSLHTLRHYAGFRTIPGEASRYGRKARQC